MEYIQCETGAMIAIFLKKKNRFILLLHVRGAWFPNEGRTLHASHWVQYFVSVCLVMWCAWDLGGSGSVQLT